jgi:hypothetical protein
MRDVDLDVLGGRGRRLLSPELVDDPIHRDGLVRTQQKKCEHGALLGAP